MYVDEIWSLEVNGPSESNPLNCLLVFGNFWKDRLVVTKSLEHPFLMDDTISS